MKDNENLGRRLALLGDIELSPADLEAIRAEIKDLDRIVAELEKFAEGIPWISLQDQPTDKKP
jgi:hypothetical protein